MISTTQVNVNFRHIFKDLVYGWSLISHKGNYAYLKHLSVFDQVDIEDVRQQYYDKAKSRGLPTEAESLERLRQEGMWTEEDEGKIAEQLNFIHGAQKTKKQYYLKAEIEKANKDIKVAQVRMLELQVQKDSLLGQTCEKYAISRLSDHYILESLYHDEKLVDHVYGQEDVDDMSREEMREVVATYNTIYSVFDDENIQKVILQDFYQPYLPFCENVNNMFSKPLFELSVNQVKLVIYSRMFKNVFENYPNIPDRIKTDPSKIIDYVNAQEKAKDTLKNMDKEGASTIVGAKKEDYEYLGIQQTDANSLTSMLKEKGGKMDMKDLMKAVKG
jgi:hypothetical protein